MDELNKNLDKDSTSRNRIVSETDRNFFVEAGAGSGKTTMLVNRMVAMVEQGKDISEICAITFTKAAAGEFYDRFQKMLIERSNPEYLWEDKGFAGQLPEPTDETRKRCAEALKNIDLCFMGTIDAFCNLILSEHPSEAKIPSDAKVITGADEPSLYRQMFTSISNGEYGEELKKQSDTFRLLYRNPEKVFVKGLSILMGKRNVHFNYKERQPVDFDEVYKTQKKALTDVLEFIIGHPELMHPTGGNKKIWDNLPSAYKNINSRWNINLSNVTYQIKQIKEVRLSHDALEKYGPSLGTAFEVGGTRTKWLQLIEPYKDTLYSELREFNYDFSMTFLSKCVSIVEKVMREKGCLTYFDCLYYLRNMLKDDAAKDGKLIKYISKKHKYFLIDEFQDTNPMQAEVFFYLASDNPVEIWSDCIPRSGALFIVGDPKQSIYRFRNADVASFLKVKKLFDGVVGEVLSLSRNFRSQKTLLEYYNRVFTQLLPEENENQSKFEKIPLPDNDGEEFGGVFKYTAYINGADKAHPFEADPLQIAKIIETLVNNDEYKISSGTDKQRRKIKYSDIMIITYKKNYIRPISQVLNAVGIPTRVEGNVPFGSNEALGEIYRIYAAVADKNDKMALYDALTGKLINLLPSEILDFKNSGGILSLEQVKEKVATADETSEKTNAETEDKTADNPLTTKVKKKTDELRELSYRARKLSPAALFAEIMDTYEVFMNVSTDNLEVLYYTLELLRKAENSGLIVSIKDGADFLAGLFKGALTEERCLSLKDNIDCVHMANLHKVKGLEAPVVILSGMKKIDPEASVRIEHGGQSSEGYIFKIEKESGYRNTTYFETDRFAEETQAELAASDSEKKRLVYVAATRAANSLIICDSVILHFNNEKRSSLWDEIIEPTTPDFFAEIKKPEGVEKKTCERVSPKELYDKAGEECVLKERTSETSTFELKNPSKERVSSKTKNDMSEVVAAADAADIEEEAVLQGEAKSDGQIIKEAEEEKASKNKTIAATRGTMVHRLMEVIISTRAAGNTEDVIDEIIREYRTPESLPYEEELAGDLNSAAITMLAGGYPQEGNAPEDIVKELISAEECHTEVPFCYKENDGDHATIWKGIMDVVYKKDGVWHIIDYKTNADGSHLDDKYRGQLNAYVKAFEETTGEKVADAHTYHIGV